MFIECKKGWIVAGESHLPIMEGEKFKGEYQDGEITWTSMEGNLNPGMEFQFVGRQLVEFFKIIDR